MDQGEREGGGGGGGELVVEGGENCDWKVSSKASVFCMLFSIGTHHNFHQALPIPDLIGVKHTFKFLCILLLTSSSFARLWNSNFHSMSSIC